MIKSLDHIAVVTSDVERAAKFYIEALGFHETMRLDTTHSGVIIFVSLGGCQVELFDKGKPKDLKDSPYGGEQVGYKHLTLLVDSVDEEHARLKGLGVEFFMDPTSAESGLRLAFFKDPDGNAIELLERPA